MHPKRTRDHQLREFIEDLEPLKVREVGFPHPVSPVTLEEVVFEELDIRTTE